MTITLAKRTQTRVKKKYKYVPCLTTFITEDGPAVGTIWFDREGPTRECVMVEGVYAGEGFAKVTVHYTNEGWDDCADFLGMVRTGRYVLVGVQPPAYSHTVT